MGPMDRAEKNELSRIHAREIDAPFGTFDVDGVLHHGVGLMQAWVRGYTDPDAGMSADPPRWTPEFLDWLSRHGCAIVEAVVGPPAIRFPGRPAADLFRVEWHERARKRYPYAQRARYEAAFTTGDGR